jgi:hypothetical protein
MRTVLQSGDYVYISVCRADGGRMTSSSLTLVPIPTKTLAGMSRIRASLGKDDLGLFTIVVHSR